MTEATLQRIERTAREAYRYWRRAGVPRYHRQHQRLVLIDQLHAAVADGHDPVDVVGGEVAAFASDWARCW